MRKYLTREVTSTKVKIAKMEMENGMPVAVTLPDEEILGNATLEQAQKQITKKHGKGVTVFEVEPNTQKYKMAVEDFLAYAELVTDEDADSEESDSVE